MRSSESRDVSLPPSAVFAVGWDPAFEDFGECL
jgi:hypothetical protein